MDADRVPLEIWLKIFEIVYEGYSNDNYTESHCQDFNNFMTVCRSWHLPAKQFLYRSVHITTVLSLTRLVDLLKRNHLGHHVKNVRILGYGDPFFEKICYPQHLVNDFIRLCPNVEELDMRPNDLWELFIHHDNIPIQWRYLRSVFHFPSSNTYDNAYLNVYYYYRASLTNMSILPFRDRSDDFLKWRQKLCEFPAITCLLVASPTLFASMQLLSPVIQSMRALKRLSTSLISPSMEGLDIQQQPSPLPMENISIAFTHNSFEWKNVSYVTRLFSTVDSAGISIQRCFYSWTQHQVSALHDLLDLLPRCKSFKVMVTQDESVVDTNAMTILNTHYHENILKHYQVECTAGIERILQFHFFIDHEAKDYSLSPSSLDSYTTLDLEGGFDGENNKTTRNASFVHNESDIRMSRWLDIIRPVFHSTCSYINTLVFDFTRTVLGEKVCPHSHNDNPFDVLPSTYTIMERFPVSMFLSLRKITINSYLAKQFSIFAGQENATVEQLELAQCHLTGTFIRDSLICFTSLSRLALVSCHIDTTEGLMDFRHTRLRTLDLMKPCLCHSIIHDDPKLDYKGYFLIISVEQQPDRHYMVSRDFYIVEETSSEAFYRHRQMQSKNHTPTVMRWRFAAGMERIHVYNDYLNIPKRPLRSFQF
ncbi:hypothetical protein K501DRAFT_282234 [Backusella circina FSU 941]|nr:hypothetical protein K501DRAFT_282234 [Backusella circina FSU 941]